MIDMDESEIVGGVPVEAIETVKPQYRLVECDCAVKLPCPQGKIADGRKCAVWKKIGDAPPEK